MDDILNLIGAVDREVVNRTYLGAPARAVVCTRTYDADLGDVWDALTSAERIPRWLLPISGDLRAGGRYRLDGNAEGEILECEPPTQLAVTWEYDGDTSWVEVTLTEDPSGGTRLRLEHIARVDDDRWNEFGPGAVGVGWDLALVGLDEYLRTNVSLDGDAWSASDAGKEFMRGSSEGWFDASVANGTDADAARLAADRTTAAYTGGETAEH